MSEEEKNAIRNKIVEALVLSAAKIVQKKKKAGQMVVVSINDKIQVLNPADLK